MTHETTGSRSRQRRIVGDISALSPAASTSPFLNASILEGILHSSYGFTEVVEWALPRHLEGLVVQMQRFVQDFRLLDRRSHAMQGLLKGFQNMQATGDSRWTERQPSNVLTGLTGLQGGGGRGELEG